MLLDGILLLLYCLSLVGTEKKNDLRCGVGSDGRGISKICVKAPEFLMAHLNPIALLLHSKYMNAGLQSFLIPIPLAFVSGPMRATRASSSRIRLM